MPEVRLHDTFLSGLCYLPPRMKNQHGLNEKNTPIKKISQLSACDVTRIDRLDTNNQA